MTSTTWTNQINNHTPDARKPQVEWKQTSRDGICKKIEWLNKSELTQWKARKTSENKCPYKETSVKEPTCTQRQPIKEKIHVSIFKCLSSYSGFTQNSIRWISHLCARSGSMILRIHPSLQSARTNGLMKVT